MKDGSMRIELKPATVEKIEKLSGEKMTTRCDRVVNKALDAANQNPSPEKDQENNQADCLNDDCKEELTKNAS